MDENLKHLENEVEKEVASILCEPGVPIPGDVLARTRLAVRHELNEQWLANRAATPVSSQAIARTKSAVRQELSRQYKKSLSTTRSNSPRVGSIMAAAAVILLCIGLIQHAAHLKSNSIRANDRIGEPLELFVKAGDTAPQEELLTTIASDLDDVEQNLEQWPTESSGWGLEEMESDPNENTPDGTS